MEPQIEAWCIHVQWSKVIASCRCTVTTTMLNISTPFWPSVNVWPLARSTSKGSLPTSTITRMSAACSTAIASQPAIERRLFWGFWF